MHLSDKLFIHGTSDIFNIRDKLLPPSMTGNLSEKDRKKNLDKIFFTDSLKYAKIYADRTCNIYGGNSIIFRVIPFLSDISAYKLENGCNIYIASYAFVEEYDN